MTDGTIPNDVDLPDDRAPQDCRVKAQTLKAIPDPETGTITFVPGEASDTETTTWITIDAEYAVDLAEHH